MFLKQVAISFIGVALCTATLYGQNKTEYQKPPQSIQELIDAPLTPQVSVVSEGALMLIAESKGFPSIEDVSQPILRIGGLRINPGNNTSSTGSSYTTFRIKNIKSGKEYSFSGLPAKPSFSNLSISPDKRTIAFTQQNSDGVELWVADMETFQARKLIPVLLNDTYGRTFTWAPDSKSLLIQSIPSDRGPSPTGNNIPQGPVIQENLGKKAPSRTYQNLLKNAHDERLFDYYLTAQLLKVDLSGKTSIIGKPAIYIGFEYSPDGNYILTQTIQRPYSYLVPVYLFPNNTSVLDQQGNIVKSLFNAPLAENRPSGFDAVATGPREYKWNPEEPAALLWAEAQDEGNPNKETAIRDLVYSLKAPFSTAPQKIASCEFRYREITFMSNKLALVTQRWWKTRMEKLVLIDPANGTIIKTFPLRSYEDTYTDPGEFVYTRNKYNKPVVLLAGTNGATVFTIGEGASAHGDRPFLLKLDLMTGKTDTLFKSKAPYYERPVFFNNKGTLIISSESVDQAPNYYLINLKNRSSHAITSFPNPYPSLKGVQKQQLAYKRRDGISMTGTLYLPEGYKKTDGPLPMLMWAYPREFKSADAASQVKGSPFRFTRISWGSPICWVTRGYAVLDNADMPIVGEGKNEPNDTFVQQVQDNAQAAIDYVSSLGVADKKRIAVGGHSYGAFMTANLLAHTNLFAAGIARSGAYNRTLTPFGFQQEERTYWQAPDVYFKMSPFSYADKIKTPILLIHGEADENSGTFPIQSERFYNALKGHGATARLVFLPNESHRYYAKESVMHMLWEMDNWLEKYVKGKTD